jgi:gliding motility-associated-like protein
MRNRLLLFAVLFVVCSKASLAQLVGTDAFLQGQWLEIGETTNGSFGANTSPVGYHPHTFGTELAEVYDYGHDGWGVGAPPFMGDYTYPGYPFEGWELQIGGVRNQAFQSGGFPGGGTLTGNITSYSNIGGRILGNWTGSAAPGNVLKIYQETRVDTGASWVVVTTKMYNTSAAPIPAVYYMRSCDPDNDETWPGGAFFTNNQVDYQNDPQHRVLVEATGQTGIYTRWGLGTKDCRAVAAVYNAWPLSGTVDLSTIWNQTYGTASYAVGVNDPGDIGIILVYNIGTILPFDSAAVSYAYIFGAQTRTTLIDSAFPDPVLSINNVVITTFPDTFDACAFPTLDSVPISITYGDDKCWTWGKWTWSPSTALSSSTGVKIWADLTAIPSYITYTVTGVDSAANMYSCNMKTFVFTLKSCHSAWNNSPCYGDGLLLGMRGDSTGATYYWWGPHGFTSTMHDPRIIPAVFADSGLYHVVKTIGGIHDTDSTYVVIHPKPILNVTSNGPLCSGLVDTLLLNVLPASPGETFLWSGPNSFTSTVSNPTVPNFIGVNAGIYTVVGVSSFGCKDTGTVNVGIVPPPPPPVIGGTPVYCYGAQFDTFTVTGANVLWYYPDSTVPGVTKKPTVNTLVPGNDTFYATQTFGCISPKAWYIVTVRPQIIPDFSWNTTLGCAQDQVTFTNLSVASWYSWEFGDGGASTDTFTTSHAFLTHKIQKVTLRAYIPGCELDTTELVNTTHSVTALFASTDTMCAGQMTFKPDSFAIFTNKSSAIEPNGPGGTPNIGGMINMSGVLEIGNATITNLPGYSWTFGDGATSSLQNPATHIYNAGGLYKVSLTVTDSIGCVDSFHKNIVVLQYGIQITHDTMLCISQPLPLNNTIIQVEKPGDGKIGIPSDFTYNWTPADHLDDTSAKVPFYTGQGLTTYTFTVTENLYGCYARDTERVHSVIGVVLQNVTTTTTIIYGSSIQLNADSEVIYLWKPDNGTLSNPNINNPIAKPTVTTLYTVYGYDHNGCLDSAFVNVIVDSNMAENVPSGFTPNGDGLNDVFRPVGIKFQNMLEFRIYNRWGQQLFYSNNPKVGWDGTFNGVPQDIGVYYYVIIVGKPGGDGLNLTYKGEVTLIR